MDKLFSTKIVDNYFMDDNRMGTSDDDNTREINDSIDEDTSDTDEAPVAYKIKRSSNQNGEKTRMRNNADKTKYYAKQQKIQRQPTRRPDPRVCNRNALMARENRRRKKELIHQMENQINDASKENRYLKKLVKQQGLMISKLNNEKLYYKSIIANRTEIVKLLQVIGTSDIPMTSCVENKHKIRESNCTSSSTKHENDLGCETPSSTLSEDFGDSACGLNGWDNLLNFNELMPIFSEGSELEKKIPLDIRSEHNYTYTDESVKPGVCIHVSSGRVSLEFCASCHNRAQDAYLQD